MAKRSPNTTENKLKKGIGQGHGKDYKPWLTVRDVPSQGLSTRVRGWKTGRVHHFLSLNALITTRTALFLRLLAQKSLSPVLR